MDIPTVPSQLIFLLEPCTLLTFLSHSPQDKLPSLS